MGILGGNQSTEPLHCGEVFGVWSYLSSLKGFVAHYETLVNHTGDGELAKLIEDSLQRVKKEEQEIEDLLKVNEVSLPPTPPGRPKANIEEIPVGARFNDNEIAAMLTRDVAMGLVACSQVIGQSTREDIAMMFSRYHQEKTQLGSKLLRLEKEKGWLVLPPLHTQANTQEA
ncbi:DUF3231 family protein [Thalassorhabdus alkalitolerans]|uniref:DUF3231 family protein n=1 Tax=Thalassorhabdus alkalitolerans TaxID=2282697 RepID=A0ABW0YVN1_9BACI